MISFEIQSVYDALLELCSDCSYTFEGSGMSIKRMLLWFAELLVHPHRRKQQILWVLEGKRAIEPDLSVPSSKSISKEASSSQFSPSYSMSLSSSTNESIAKDLLQFFNRKEFSDVMFKLPSSSEPHQQRLYAHRVILAARCKVFFAMFQNSMLESQMREIEIVDTSADAFRLLIEFLYAGSVRISNTEILCEMLSVADKYLLPQLHSCILESVKPLLTCENLLYFYYLAIHFNSADLTAHCTELLELGENLYHSMTGFPSIPTYIIEIFLSLSQAISKTSRYRLNLHDLLLEMASFLFLKPNAFISQRMPHIYFSKRQPN